MKKLDVTQPIMNILTNKQVDMDDKPLTLRSTAVTALIRIEENDSAEQKVMAYKLSMKLMDEDQPNLTVDELKSMKDKIGKAFGPMIVGQAFDMIESIEKPVQAVK